MSGLDAGVCAWSGRLGREPIASMSEESLEALIAHAEVCAGCQERLAAGEGGGPLVEALRAVGADAPASTVDVAPPLKRLNELLEDYEILGELGRGGMGVVYRARQASLDRVVALKVLPALIGVVRPGAASRFRREAALAARLKHTNIIGVHDFGEADGTLYYTMELVEGRTLRDLLDELREAGGVDGARLRYGSSDATRSSSRESSRTYFRRAALWMADVANALAYAHDRGVLHRDIKPSNLIVASDGRIMISDFGLARPAVDSSATEPRALLGTLRYMGPERIDPEFGPIDGRTDVYCLGATLYELLTLRPVFEARDDRALLQRILHHDPARPSSVSRQVPSELETICLKALAKRPEDRYEGAAAMEEDLRRWLLGIPIVARRPSLALRAVKFVRRRRGFSALLAASVLLGGTALYMGWSAQEAGRRERAAEGEAQVSRAAVLAARAKEALEAGRFEESVELFGEAAAIVGKDADLERERAMALWLLGRGREAESVLEGILASRPDDALTYYRLGLLHQWREAEQHRGRAGAVPEAAARHFAGVVRLAPDSVLALHARAAMVSDPAEARRLLGLAEDAGGAPVEALLHRTVLLRRMGLSAEALPPARRAAALRPGWPVTHFVVGSVLLDLQRYQEAERVISRAIELSPGDPKGWHNRSIARSGAGDFDRAIADAVRALDLDPEFTSAYFALARARAKGGQFDAALADLNVALRRYPDDKEAYIERARLHNMRGDFEGVAADAARLIQLDPEDVRGYQLRSLAMLLMGRYDRALPDARRCVEMEPGNVAHHQNLASLLVRMGRSAEAAEVYTRAIELEPLSWRHVAMRGMAHFRSGRPERAVTDLTRGEELNPAFYEAALWRALAFWELGLADLAVQDLLGVADAHGGATRAYAGLLAHLVLLDMGDGERAAAFVRPEYLGAAGSWEEMLAAMFRDEVGSAELLEAAATEDERAEALFYLGARAVVSGDDVAGRRLLEECAMLGATTGVLETDAAASLLRRLERSVPGGVGVR